MYKIIATAFLLLWIHTFSFAQCSGSEVEIKVEIATDEFGGETYWTLKDLSGNILLQGGQGGVYGNNRLYLDSICVAGDGCFFFEIFDTYGDGIFAPYGYKLFVDEALISTGADDIKSYVAVTAYCPGACDMVLMALNDFSEHITGNVTLTTNELTQVRNIFVQFPECFGLQESTILLCKNIVDEYDARIGVLFTTPNTVNGFSKNVTNAPGLELERAMLALQQGIFEGVFTPEVYAVYPQHLDGWKFKSCSVFPGDVDSPADPNVSHPVWIRANFADPDGMNPYFDINQDRTNHALRPTGLYLAPGSIASITVPDSLVGKDYWVRVGSHDWDLTDRAEFYRLDRISKKILIDSTTVNVFNPLGGAISILVPYGADEGIVTIYVKNGVEAPFFSIKSFYETVDFEAEMEKPGPWAVFETDNVMYTIPKHSIVPGQYDLRKTLKDWDLALRAVNSIMARQIIPDKHNMYMIADVDIRFGAYSIGYPMSNTPLRYTDVPGPAYFINGPGPDDEVNFHESGHALAMSKFPGEEEALVNFPYIMAMHYGLNTDLNEAVNYSFVPNTFDIDKTATHRMVSNSFGSERDISNTTNDEVRYQHRGYGHYFEIVNMMGWCPLRNFWKQEFIDFKNGTDYGIYQDIDSRILRMCVAAKADLRPLFHVFGILPKNPVQLQDTMVMIGIKPSGTIYNRLIDYRDLIPKDKEAFIDYALFVYPNLYTDGPTESPDYGVGWHYQKSLTYDETEASVRTDILESIISLYFPNGQPTDEGLPDLCCLLDTLQIDVMNDEIFVTGGVKPYQIVTDTTDNLRTVTVTDFDGCESKVQFMISGVQDKESDGLLIYPNPASTEILISQTDTDSPIESVQLMSTNGQIIRQFQKGNRVIDISTMTDGMYILQIGLAGGKHIYKKVMIFR